VLPVFVLITFLEFNYWFYNNEMPAYFRAGVIGGEASAAIKAFYEAARSACSELHPNLIQQCEDYQLALLADARYIRPVSTVVGLLLTAMTEYVEFMQALKYAIITLAVGGAILCGLTLLPFLAGLEGRALAALGIAWVGGWIGTRPLLPNILLVVFAFIVIALATLCIRTRGLPSAAIAIKSLFRFEHRTQTRLTLTFGLGLLATILCFWLGYRVHLAFESRFPFLYLLLAIGLWPLLNRVLPISGNWMLSGLLCAVLYLAATLVPVAYSLSLAKQHQQTLVGLFIFIAIWRNDTRVFWALPLLLLFDMQNAARVSALIIVAEGIVALTRRQLPIAIVPAALTAVVGLITTKVTAVYPFGDRLYRISDVIEVLLTPEVLTASLVALVIISVATGQSSRQSAPVALDRMFVYAASVVVMAGIQILTLGLLFDAFQLSNILHGVALAPAIAIFSVVVGLCLRCYKEGAGDFHRRNSIASIAALLLLMSTTRGHDISLFQLSEGALAAVSDYFPEDWLRRRTPYMTLHDNVIYLDAANPMTSPLMQYSLIKIFLLSRTSRLANEGLTILPFGQLQHRAGSSPLPK